MYAIEFETVIRNGLVKIPENYSRAKNGRAKIVVLLEEDEEAESAITERAINFSEHHIDAFQEVDGVAWQRQQRDAW